MAPRQPTGNRPGRPPSTNPHTRVLSVRLTDEEYAAAVEAAGEEKVGPWARRLVNEGSGIAKPRRKSRQRPSGPSNDPGPSRDTPTA